MNKRAFSLAEMLVVLVIISVIMAMTAPIISKRAKVHRAAAAGGAVNLPIAAEGDYCPDPTDGQVDKNLAITADRTKLLTCQPTGTLAGSCPTVGAKAVDTTGGVITHIVCQ